MILAIAVVAFSQISFASELEETNKKVVIAFFELAFNKHKPREATQKYFGESYIQHNPSVANGADAFVAFFEPLFKKNPDSKIVIKRIIAKGDLVVVHAHGKVNDKTRGLAIMDIFRLKNGKLVEHWDVVQEVPEKAANDNTMF